MKNWPCKLQAQDPDPELRIAPTVAIRKETHSPLGTFSAENTDEIIIMYNPAIASNPTQLIATFAHELAHYLTGTCPESPPGGWKNWEFATDIAAVFMGFGVFLANSAFTFSQFSDFDSQGWPSSRSGYLTEPEFSFALAIFIKLKGIDPKTVNSHLKTNIKSFVKKALAELEECEQYQELTKVKYEKER